MCSVSEHGNADSQNPRAPVRFPLPVLTNFIAAWKQIRKETKRSGEKLKISGLEHFGIFSGFTIY